MIVRRWFDVALAIAFLVVAVLAIVMWSVASTSIVQVRKVAEHERLDSAARSLLEGLIDVETGTRGFAITGRDEYLEPYEEGAREIEANLNVLRSSNTAAVTKLQTAIDGKLLHAESIIATRRSQGRDAALAIIATGKGKELMDSARAQLRAIVDTADRGMNDVTAVAYAESVRVRTMAVVAIAFTFATLLVAFFLVRRALARMIGERDRSEDRLRELIADAPEPYWLTDTEGVIIDTNAAMEQLLGYERGALIGRSIRTLVPEDAMPRFNAVREAPRTPNVKRVSEWKLRAAHGQLIPVEVNARLSPDGRWQAFVHDLTDRERLEEQRRAALTAREELIAVVAHDLKSPLNAIELRERMLTRAKAPNVEQHSAAVRRSIVMMQRMIRGLLHSVSLETGKLDLELGEHDPHGLVTEVVDVLGPVAADLEIELVTDVRTDRPVVCDRDRILQVIYNLVSNALKFTPRGGKVTISIDNVGDTTEIRVLDTGEGIAPESLSRVFEKFYTSGGRYGGTGLGLDIAKGLVEAHGGTITVASTVGAGSTFAFTIPPRAPS